MNFLKLNNQDKQNVENYRGLRAKKEENKDLQKRHAQHIRA